METKKQLKERCKKILNSYNLCEYINKEDFDFMISIIEEHPNRSQKVGSGIKNIFISMTQYKTRGFCIERIDGTITDFSYISCVDPKNKLDEIKIACRYAIKNDIMNIKNGSSKEAHHSGISFHKIVNMWLEGKNTEEIELLGHEDNSTHLYFKNADLASDFVEFHNKKAKIELLDKNVHRHLKKGEVENGKRE